MPEAVASNSIPMSGRQPHDGWKDHFSEQFEEIEHMLNAFNEMNVALYQTRQDHSAVSHGIYLLHRTIMDRLTAVSREVDGVFVGAALVEDKRMISMPLWERVTQIVGAAYRDMGRDPEDPANWSEQDGRKYFRAVTDYYNAIVAKAGGVDDVLELGSLLPWLEVKARHEIVGEEPVISNEANSLRDRLITQQAKKGVSPAEISHAFNLRRGAVERIIARLTAEEDAGREAI